MDNVSPSLAAVNSPQLDPQTLIPQMRAVKDAAQAFEIAKALEIENRDRNKQNARIMDRYNAERPHNPSALEAEGLAWKNNFSTKPLPHLIDKVAPRFVAAVKGMRYLTASAFPDNVPGASAKTEAFRAEITKVCRTREGWNDFLSEVAQENALFGFTSVSWHDEFSWFPKHFRQDKFFVPRGTKHYASSAQIYVYKEDFLIHELFKFIEDPNAAKVAGWNVENTVEALNSATPDTIRSKAMGYERIYADLQRELTIGSSFTNGARMVTVYGVLAVEITGKVSHYIVSEKDGKELFTREDRFESMADASSFYSFQHGDGKLHGSKGIGREVYNMAGALDRARNDVVDRLQMAGKVIVSCDEKQIKRFRMSVLGNAIIISNAFAVSSTRIDGDVEPFLKLDSFFTELLDQIAGSASPKALEGERVTKAAVELYASREEERRDAVIDRFLSQFARMMNTIQRRMCDPRTGETDALAMQQRLLAVMSPEELQWISTQPAAETVQDYSEQERQQIVLVAQEAKGNPLYNQKELEKRKLTAQVNSDFADSVLLPDNDPTQTAEQTRQQTLENVVLANGQGVPVSPRDDFQAHFQTLEPLILATAQSVINQPELLPHFKAQVAHANDHLQTALQGGVDKKSLGDAPQKVKTWIDAATQLDQHEQQAQAVMAQTQGAPQPQQAPPQQPAI